MLRYLLLFLFGLMFSSVVGVVAVVAYLLPTLPSVEVLRDIQLQEPLRVYSRDFQLIEEFGDKRRTPVDLAEIPDLLVQAFLVTEDEHFFEHSGVDLLAMVRAGLSALTPGRRTEGASTITMQLVRNIFLSPERTITRKAREILLALRIESTFDKASILELYLNKVFLGQRSYGVAAAAQTYYGKSLEELTLPEVAMLAGLPKAPSGINPITDPEAALSRRRHVLNRLLSTGHITAAEHAAAVDAPETARLHGTEAAVSAGHLAEMVRAELVGRYGPEVYDSGLRVITTLDSRLQEAGTSALRSGLLDYERRHGYYGPEAHIDPPADASAAAAALRKHDRVGDLQPAVVMAVREREALVWAKGVGDLTLDWEALSWARMNKGLDNRGPAPKAAGDVLKPGDIIRVERIKVTVTAGDEGTTGVPRTTWRLAQIPKVEGALVALDPADGAIRALVGGFDYNRSKFNRALQARRQPGSNFKPFVYSAALDAGFTPASFVNDAPIVFETPGLAEAWRPENYSGRYYGPTRLREALTNSRNLVSIRLLRSVGVERAIDYVTRFGFERAQLPQNLSLSLGTGEVTPLQLVAGYAVFANGGYAVKPHFIHRIDSRAGTALTETSPLRVCRACDDPAMGTGEEPVELVPVELRAPRVVDAGNVWMMTSMLKDVIRRGTGQKALSLKRSDIAGKTGTTNDQKDAWFSGYNADIVATTWVGFDQSQPLGKLETGAKSALPIWIDFMGVALAGKPPAEIPEPPGLVAVRIDPDTGLLAPAGQGNAITEHFPADRIPGSGGATVPNGTAAEPALDQALF
jgi:penicillin-binding protein 1A